MPDGSMGGQGGSHAPAGGGTAPGTSAGGVCWTGGADESATILSLTERVTQLEEKMAQMFGADWETAELSNGTSQLGWITGVTYMGVPGWTQTEYGTLIPPAGFSLSTVGFTMSDGSTWPAVVMDENGVLQYGFGGVDADGNFLPIGGALGGSLTGNAFAVLTTNNPIRDFTSSSGQSLGTITIQHDPNGLVTLLTSQRFAVTTSGWYLVSMISTLQCYNDASGNGETWLRWQLTGNPSHFDLHFGEALSLYTDANGTASHPHIVNASRVMFLSASAYSEIFGITQNGGGTPTMKVAGATMSLQLLAPAASP